MVSSESREEITARIKEEADIVQIIGECVDLKRSGTRYLGLCPFHGEKTPSFSVHGGQQFFHCFGCGESGDVFSFVMKYHSLGFPEAVKTLADRYHIEVPQRRRSKEEEQRIKKREQLFEVNDTSAVIYSRYLKEAAGAKAARGYLQKRGVNSEIQKKFRIGYAPSVEVEGWNFLSNQLAGSKLKAATEAGLLVEKEKGGTYDRFRDRIVFPIMDISGRVCGFGGRIVGDGQPKYLNSPESPVFNKSKLLLGLYQQKEEIRRKNEVVLVEGNFDLISLVASGYTNVVAPLGTALTREQLRLLKRFSEKVILLFDGDEAGGKAAVRGVPLFLAEQIAGWVALLPDGHDPDTFVRQKGLAALNTLIEQSESLPEFVLGRWIKEYGLTLDGKQKILEELRPLVKAAVSPLQRSVFISHFAEKLGMDRDQLGRHFDGPSIALAAGGSPAGYDNKVREQRTVPLSMPQRQLLEFMILRPKYFSRLEEGSIRQCLAGGIGEILFLQFKRLLEENPQAEPEEFLTALPEGAERDLVANFLAEAPKRSQVGEAREELDDLLDYIKKFHLKRSSEELMERIERAQEDGDLKLMQELMAEKIDISRRLLGEEL